MQGGPRAWPREDKCTHRDTGWGDRPCTGPKSWEWGEHSPQQARVGEETQTRRGETDRRRERVGRVATYTLGTGQCWSYRSQCFLKGLRLHHNIPQNSPLLLFWWEWGRGGKAGEATLLKSDDPNTAGQPQVWFPVPAFSSWVIAATHSSSLRNFLTYAMGLISPPLMRLSSGLDDVMCTQDPKRCTAPEANDASV